MSDQVKTEPDTTTVSDQVKTEPDTTTVVITDDDGEPIYTAYIISSLLNIS